MPPRAVGVKANAPHHYQAVLEGIAMSNTRALHRMGELHPDVRVETIAVYGGGSRSRAWNQIKADIAGVAYDNLGDAPVTALGAAMVAAQGVGLVADAVARCVELRVVQERFEPRADNVALYRELLGEPTTLF